MPNNKILKVWDVPFEQPESDASDLIGYLMKDGCKNAIDNDPVEIGVHITEEENRLFMEMVDVSETGSLFFVRYITKPEETLDDIFNYLPADIQKYVKPTFDEVKKHIKHCSEYNVCWLGNAPGLTKVNSSFKHIHPRYKDDKDFSLSYTSLIPVVIKNEINEKLPLQWTDMRMPSIEYYNKNHYKCFKDQQVILENRSGPIEYIDFPPESVIRYIKFNSTNWIHWTENLSNNIYLVSLFEDCTEL